MLLRSSSTPLLGSLLSSFSDSPNNNNIHHDNNTVTKHHHHHHHHHIPPTSAHHSHNKRAFGSLNFHPVSCNSSPISPSIADLSDLNKGFGRAQSEGNLEGLAYASCNKSEDFNNKSLQSRKFQGRNKCLMLQTIPSFSFSNLRGMREDEEDESDIEDEEDESDIEDEEERQYLEENEERSEKGRERVMAVQGGEIGFKKEKTSTVFSEEVKVLDKIWSSGADGERGVVGPEMYLARGLEIGGGGGGSSGGGGNGGEFNSAGSGGDNEDNPGVEEYYKKMVEENPGNPLFLRNYGHFLYQRKQDLHRAEEYYSRAILADPGDGEILSQYAKLVWELHHDQDRASNYFERSIHAAPDDCYVQAAYATFLWDMEEDDGECRAPNDLNPLPPQFHKGAVASTTA